jgi:ArsR family transcriptional regulator
MEAILGYRQAYLSQQLSVLREAGIIQDRRDGWNIFYRIVKPEVLPLIAQVRAMLNQPDKNEPLRHSSEKCPCPKCAAEKVQS